MAKSIKDLFRQLAQAEAGEWLETQPAWLGKWDETIATDRAGVIWVRLINGKEIEVYNQIASSRFDLPVKIGRSRTLPNIWQVIEVREFWDDRAASGEIAYHAAQHLFDAGDEVAIDRRQIIDLTVRVSDSENFIVKVGGGLIPIPSGWAMVAAQLVDLSSYVPSAGALYASIEADETGTLSVHVGDVFEAPAVASLADVPTPASGKVMLGFAMLYEGQDALLNEHIRVPMPINTNLVTIEGNFVRKFTGMTTAPTVNDDIDDGYLVTDIWMDETNNEVYICRDNAAGAADWLLLGSTTTHFEPVSANVPREFDAWHIEGALSVTTNAALAILATKAMKLTTAYIWCDDPGSASSTIVDINLNGTTIFATSANRPTLAFDDADGWTVSGDPDVVDVAIGDILSIDIDQIATGAAGLRVAVMELINELIYDVDNALVMTEVEN